MPPQPRCGGWTIDTHRARSFVASTAWLRRQASAWVQGRDPRLKPGCTAVTSSAMPVFEFRCQDCGKRFSALIGVVSEPDDEKCTHCGSTRTAKLVSRFARVRTEDDRIDALADELETVGEPDSPGEMRRMVREMGKAMDEDMADEMEEMFEADMAGELEDDV